MSVKQKIIMALHEKINHYKTYPDFETAQKFFLEDNSLDTVDSGYFKYFFKWVVQEDILNRDPNHNVSKDILRYTSKQSTKSPSSNSNTSTVELTEDLIRDFELKVFSPSQVTIDPDMFLSYVTDTEIDEIFSDDGGVMSATSVMVTGGPGVGKSTVLFWLASRLKEKYPKKEITIVSSEMEEEDLLYETKKKPWMNTLQFILTSEYGEKLPLALTKIFREGNAIIILDSFADICEKLKDFCGYSSSRSENFILDLMKKAKGRKAGVGEFTTTLAIQQVTKGGTFTGSNKLKHNTTAMLELKRESSGDRYMTFSKNRRCGAHVGKKLYYFLGANNQVNFDTERWEREKVGEEDQTAGIEGELLNNQLLDSFTNLNAEQTLRLKLLQQHEGLNPEMLQNINDSFETEIDSDKLNLPEGISYDQKYLDDILNFYVLETGTGIPIYGITEKALKQNLFNEFGYIEELQETE